MSARATDQNTRLEHKISFIVTVSVLGAATLERESRKVNSALAVELQKN